MRKGGKQMKGNDNKYIKFTVFILLITIVAFTLVSGTYAKYTSSVTGSDTATVAKWSIKVGGKDIAQKEAVTFDIFNTITNEDGTAEENVAKTDGTLVAPGTMGSFKIALKNESEVTAEYKTTYEVEANGIPLEFALDPNGTWSSDISTINDTAFTKLAMNAETNTTTVYWRWAFGDGATDTSDTDLGTAATLAQAKVTATIVAQQVD